MRRVLLTAALLMTAGVAGADLFEHKVTPEDLNGLTKMAVHVRLGDTFHGIFYGTTVFQNKGFDAPVPQWGMDAYAATQVIDIMNSAGRFPAVSLDVTGLDLGELYKKSGAILGSREVEAVLLEKARQQGADALMIIEMQAAGARGDYHAPGFGLFWRNAFGLSHGCVYGSFNTVVLRVDTHKRIAWGSGEPCETERGTADYPRKDSWDQYSPAEQAALESAVKEKVGSLVRGRLASYTLLK